MTELTPRCVWPVAAELGEGPIWSAASRSVYFVDIQGRRIHRLQVDSGDRTSWPVEGQPGFILPLQWGAFACGIDRSLYRFSPDAAPVFERVLSVEPHDSGNRLNDGYVDANGRFWFGTMDEREAAPTGVLYRLSDDGKALVQDRGYVITNGPALSWDGKTLYHTDTLARVIYAFDVAADGHLSNKRRFIETREPGSPDGMAVDACGFVWVAFFGGWRIDRYSPHGECCESVRFPCANVTKLAFGGDDLRTVYVTTARKGLSAQELSEQPLAGGLFEFRSPIAGVPQAVGAHPILS